MSGAIKRKTVNGGARQELDKFYTKDDVALYCLNSISALIDGVDIVVEPSGGGGAFSRQVLHTNLLSYDLEPEDEDIVQANWFEITCEQLGEGSVLVIGNPPFGVRSDLAKAFIKHAVVLGAETIAFVLPDTFSKALNQQVNLFPSGYRLVIEEKLNQDSFTLVGESFHVPCSWYVWTQRDSFLPGTDFRKLLLKECEDFVFVGRGNVAADFTLNGNNGKVKNVVDVTNPKSEHYIRVNDRAKVAEVRVKFSNLVFDFKSSVNGGVAWAGKQEILEAYKKLK